MTESGNAIAERVNGILKTEWLEKRWLTSWDDALSYVEKIINPYNNERPHQSISFLTPETVHLSGIHTERKWKNYYTKKKIQPYLSIVPKVKSLQAMGNNLSSHVGNVDFEM